MDYHLETLGDERFQKLCQALLVAENPGVQCLPVGQPDGGRDGFRRNRGKHESGFAAYQVKYSKSPSSKDERDSISSVIQSERAKVNRLVERGATSYYLITNVSGTSHLDVGSIDKVNQELTDAFGIPSYCWWRDDIDRRIDASASIKWSFPEILKATDLLQALLENSTGAEQKRRGEAIRSYMVYQARYDAQLKFKQIDLQRNIIDLFVDVPARLVFPPVGEGDLRAQRRWIEELEGIGFHDSVSPFESDPSEDALAEAPGAMQLLVHDNVISKFKRIVVEGAPGQGKSTVTQYLCQVHRLALLGRAHDFGRVASQHKPAAARIPFRVDLRDYASWLSGRDPFSDDVNARLPVGSSPVLESFLAAQVHRYTGASFSVEDFTEIAKYAKVLVVLDGFDEVADTALRNRIVAEVSDATARISELALEAQVIVTSRPAAFVNSPGFPRDEWQYLQILPLSRKVIQQYAHKWLEGRAADVRERRDVLSVLKEKLDQHHIRDLARNPMQLAILLALISVQGASLPDQRTALYDKYIDIFLNRESEKSRVVRDHRPLLVQIHRFLAWNLQCEAEASGAGHISETRLKDVLRVFLESSGHSPGLIEQLFTGIVERVVALVSRVQGTFEFEVQPLREYFAARYLYDTAPYAPAGIRKSGTLPERFDAIARNFYWLNVARFYAGCYSSGELASLVENIDEINQSEQFRFIGHGIQLGITLLADHVFSQHPRLTQKLASELVSGPGFRILLAQQYDRRLDGGVALPEGPAQDALRAKCVEILQGSRAYDTQLSAAQVMMLNGKHEMLRDVWLGLDIRRTSPGRWLQLGSALSVFDRMTAEEGRSLATEAGAVALPLFIRHGRNDVVNDNPVLWDQALDEILDLGSGHLAMYPAHRMVGQGHTLISHLTALLSPYLRRQWSDEHKTYPLRRVLERGPYHLVEADHEPEQKAEENPDTARISEGIDALLDHTIAELKSDVDLWSTPLEVARSLWGTRWGLCRIAILAAEVNDGEDWPTFNLDDDRASLCSRALSARQRANDIAWWKEQMGRTNDANFAIAKFALLALDRWASMETLSALSSSIDGLVNRLPSEHWNSFINGLEDRPYGGKRHRTSTLSKVERAALPETISPRAVHILMARLRPADEYDLYRRYLSDYAGDDLSVYRSIMRITGGRAKDKPRHWPEALLAFKNGYQHGALYSLPSDRGERGGRAQMPVDVARQVCRDADSYPLRLVAVAESVLAAETGGAAIPVSKVAARDEWFEVA